MDICSIKTFSTYTLQLQKLNSVSCKEGDFTYTAAHLSPAINRIAVLLPRKLFLKFNVDNIEVLFLSMQLIQQEYHCKDSVEVLTINACFIDVSVLNIVL